MSIINSFIIYFTKYNIFCHLLKTVENYFYAHFYSRVIGSVRDVDVLTFSLRKYRQFEY